MSSEAKIHPVIWWVGWIALTIVAFFVSCAFWTPYIASHVGPVTQKNVQILWVAAVFGCWMVLLVPLIIVMYNKVDRAYEDARIGREAQARKLLATQFPVRAIVIDEERRLLPKALRKKLKRLPKTLKQGQLVSVRFKNGQELKNAFVFGGEEIVGVYGRADYPFDAREAVAVELTDPALTQPVSYDQWLRLKSAAESA